MPLPVAAGDRKLLSAIGIVFVVLVALTAFLSPPAQNETGIPSSYSASSSGAKAAYLLLKESGYRVERWERSPKELPRDPAGTVLILAGPTLVVDSEERPALLAFLANGGRVLVTGSNADWLPEFSAEYQPLTAESKVFPSQVPGYLTRQAPVISLEPTSRWKLRSPRHLPLYGGDQGAVAVTYSIGKGQVIWWASATPLTNAGLSQSHNLEFFLNCVGRADSVRVLWDEYFHGRRPSLWSLAQTTPIPYAIAQLGLLGLAIVLTFSRRNGPVRMPVEASRLSALEFVDTLGALYRKANAGSVAVEVALVRLRYSAARRFGLSVRCTANDIAQAAADRLGTLDGSFLRDLQDAERAAHDTDLSHRRALEIVQRLYRYAHLLRRKAKSKGEADGLGQSIDFARAEGAGQSHRRSATAAR